MYSDFATWGYSKLWTCLKSFLTLVDGEERRDTPDHLQGVLPQNLGGTEPKRIVICIVLKATDNDRRTSNSFWHDKFHGRCKVSCFPVVNQLLCVHNHPTCILHLHLENFCEVSFGPPPATF
ncbi:hypothetical protein TNCV_4210121 [Trichonephila clavipes]|nr:hypothetical protein TNCV_4210121 [Trichonephila clavipes]